MKESCGGKGCGQKNGDDDQVPPTGGPGLTDPFLGTSVRVASLSLAADIAASLFQENDSNARVAFFRATAIRLLAGSDDLTALSGGGL
jgi:hypothetical protein